MAPIFAEDFAAGVCVWVCATAELAFVDVTAVEVLDDSIRVLRVTSKSIYKSCHAKTVD